LEGEGIYGTRPVSAVVSESSIAKSLRILIVEYLFSFLEDTRRVEDASSSEELARTRALRFLQGIG
jgi:hypothetical protein